MTTWTIATPAEKPDMFVADMPLGTVFKATSGIKGHGGAPMLRIWHDEDECCSAVVILDGSGTTWTEHGKSYRGIPFSAVEIRVTE